MKLIAGLFLLIIAYYVLKIFLGLMSFVIFKLAFIFILIVGLAYLFDSTK